MIQEAISIVLQESDAEYLNISIKNVDKSVKDSNVASLLNQEVEVYGKYDGTKLSILRNNEAWDNDRWWKMFIVSYKGNVLYGTEYDHSTDDPKELDKTIGVSQYKSVFNHIQAYYKGWKGIPKNTEFFFEFLMNKPTLTRSYTKLRELILIGYSSVSNFSVNHGKIKTSPNGFVMDGRENFAKIFKVNLPEVLFKGTLKKLPNGLNDRAKATYANYENLLKGEVSEWEYWNLCKAMFLEIPSLYGSPKEEGVVIHLSKEIGGANILKIVQADQYDKTLRGGNKEKFKMDFETEDNYWIAVRAKAEEIIGNINHQQALAKALKEAGEYIYKKWKVDIAHSKKSELNVRDDVQLTLKSMLIRIMPGNNGALVVGKFRVFTNGHKKMFDAALKDHDSLVVALVSNNETKETLNIRRSMIQAVFPKVEIIETTSGNLLTMINRTSTNINAVYAGSDRVDAYKNQLKRNPDVSVKEILRGDDDESATKVVKNLNDVKYFNTNTPTAIHGFYQDLLNIYYPKESLIRRTIKGR